jgi:hypothetical protein
MHRKDENLNLLDEIKCGNPGESFKFLICLFINGAGGLATGGPASLPPNQILNFSISSF